MSSMLGAVTAPRILAYNFRIEHGRYACGRPEASMEAAAVFLVNLLCFAPSRDEVY